MKCQRPEIAEVLTEFRDGNLSESKVLKVRDHLKTCTPCNQRLRVINLLVSARQTTGLRNPDDHPSVILLTEFAFSESIPRQERNQIELHLSDCKECKAGLDLVKGLAKELDSELEKGDAVRKDRLGLSERLFILLRSPIPAYLLVLLLAYPAVRWFSSGSKDNEPWSTEVILKEATRSLGEEVEVIRQNKNAIVLLDIPYYALHKEKEYRFSITDLSPKIQESLYTETIATFDKPGHIKLLLNTSNYPDGSYILVMNEIDLTSAEPDLTTRYQFVLITKN